MPLTRLSADLTMSCSTAGCPTGRLDHMFFSGARWNGCCSPPTRRRPMATEKKRLKAYNDDIARGNTGTADQNPDDVFPEDHFGGAKFGKGKNEEAKAPRRPKAEASRA